MRAGRLGHIVDIQEATETQDEYGSMGRTWETILARRAFVKPLSGREAEVARQIVATATHEVRMRYLSMLTPAHRLQFGTRTFEIGQKLNVDERNRELVLICTEQVAV